jgi:hypothetical protein
VFENQSYIQVASERNAEINRAIRIAIMAMPTAAGRRRREVERSKAAHAQHGR